MERLTLNLMVEIIDFDSVDQPSLIHEVNSFQVWNDESNESVEDLYTRILMEKGDWLRYEQIQTEGRQEVTFWMMFTTSELSDEDKQLIESIEKICRAYVSANREPTTEIDERLMNLPSTNLMGDGLIISAREIGQTGLAEILAKKLEDEGVEYTILRRQQERIDSGASGGMEHVLFFIAQWVLTSVAWDVLKAQLSKEIGEQVDSFTGTRYENHRFKRLRAQVAGRAKVDETYLILKEFLKDDHELVIIFEVDGTSDDTITLICDHGYNIKQYSYTKE
ncbi:hypothetical protein [Exiguobacterium sp. s26]|uniref:hypothetical protein n=1 Tax=Exiguobacterium sp. s26 TaxID=2751231 RepID=UPI001BE888E8|nr:hypothetical protein [Exiguobacterium sp. s26]